MIKMPVMRLVNRSTDSSSSTIPNLPDIDFMSGGKWFVDAITKYGVNESGHRLRIYPPILEAAELIGDFRIAQVNLSGAAQVFKSLIHIQLAAAAITIGKLNVIQSYPKDKTIQQLVPTQYKPIIDSWEQQLGLIRKQSPSDSKSRTIHQSWYGTLRFMGVNNDRSISKERSGIASASSNVVAVPTDLLLCDERSQSLAKDLEPLDRRLLQSKLPIKVKRYYGTCGAGAGIEADIARSDYDFYSHVRCRHCDEVSALHPLGWSIINVEPDPAKEPRYFDEAGRPLKWHCHNPDDPVHSAYYGCPHCAGEIEEEDRTHQSWFQCRKTGVTLRDLLDSLDGVPERSIEVGITLSPLIRY